MNGRDSVKASWWSAPSVADALFAEDYLRNSPERLFRPIQRSVTFCTKSFNLFRLSAPFSKYDNVLFAVFASSLLCSLWEGTDLPRKSEHSREEAKTANNTLSYLLK